MTQKNDPMKTNEYLSIWPNDTVRHMRALKRWYLLMIMYIGNVKGYQVRVTYRYSHVIKFHPQCYSSVPRYWKDTLKTK